MEKGLGIWPALAATGIVYPDVRSCAITVAEARGSEHPFVTREFTIEPGGISLLPILESKALPVLPLQSYYGLLSRAPTRPSPDLPRGGEGAADAEAT
jgi:hypothetical protein